jgi:hypothetical protein
MSRPAEPITRRAALQRVAAGSVGAAAALLAAPATLRASLLGSHAQRRAERLLMVFCRDAAFTGADELAFFHGSTTRLEPSLGAWLVHGKGPVNAQVRGLQCLEWGPMTCAQRMAYAGQLPLRCQGEASSVFEYGITQGHGSGKVARLEKEMERGARVVQTVLPHGSDFSLARYSRDQLAYPGRSLLVLAGTRERLEASVREALIPSELSAPMQLGQSKLHVVLHDAAVLSRNEPGAQAPFARPLSVRPADLHATVLAGMGLKASNLVHTHPSRRMRPLAAQGRVIPGVYV